jgi:hypothetical protein
MKTKRNLIIFIIITLASGWLGVLVDMLLTNQPEGNTLGMGLWLILPVLTGIILRLTSRDWKGAGIKPNFKGNIKWYLLSLIIYPAVTAITFCLAMFSGGINTLDFNMSILLPLMVTSAASGLIKNIFEEFAWRGYLTPKLMELGINDWLIYIISGLVWALWHSAYYLVFLPNSYFESISRVNYILIGSVLMICWTVMFVEIYRLTKSVWPCVLMHAIEDAVPTLLTTGGFIVFTNSGDIWWNPITGIVATALFLAVGLSLRYIRVGKDAYTKVHICGLLQE